STLAAGLAGGVTGGSSASALAGAQAGKNAVENNSLSGWENLPKGMMDYGQAMASWNQYAVDNNLTPEQN
ncbi:MAG: VENN motif pre-toxin domain-containing protein, partial [Pantoea dispersa]